MGTKNLFSVSPATFLNKLNIAIELYSDGIYIVKNPSSTDIEAIACELRGFTLLYNTSDKSLLGIMDNDVATEKKRVFVDDFISKDIHIGICAFPKQFTDNSIDTLYSREELYGEEKINQ